MLEKNLQALPHVLVSSGSFSGDRGIGVCVVGGGALSGGSFRPGGQSAAGRDSGLEKRL